MVNAPNDGRRQGWWGLPEPVEAFLDQIITWRDIGFIHCAMVENHGIRILARVGENHAGGARG